MSLGNSQVGLRQYRLPRRLSLQGLSQIVDDELQLGFVFVPATGNTTVVNVPDNLIWTFDPATGRLTVEDTEGDRATNFSYRGLDGHVLEFCP